MTREHLVAYARRVLTGLDDQGRSTIVSDAPPRPVWRRKLLPAT